MYEKALDYFINYNLQTPIQNSWLGCATLTLVIMKMQYCFLMLILNLLRNQ